jgi:hypothetical protein
VAIDLGDRYRVTFTNTPPGGGTPVSAGTVTLTIVLPDDTTVVNTVAPTTPGVYQFDYLTTQAGRHVAQWVGTGANPGAHVEIFDVRTLTPGYLVSLAVLKDQLNVTGTANDEALRGYIEAATDAVERIRNETIIKRTFTDELYLPDYYRGYGQAVNSAMPYGLTYRHRSTLDHTPAISLTTVARVDGTMTWDTTLLRLDPAGIIDVMYGPALSGHIAVTYVAGSRVIRATDSLAAQIIIEHLWQTRRGVRGGPRPGGMDTTLVHGLGFAIPNAALELLGAGIPGMA